jgi:hypothetical protein
MSEICPLTGISEVPVLRYELTDLNGLPQVVCLTSRVEANATVTENGKSGSAKGGTAEEALDRAKDNAKG